MSDLEHDSIVAARAREAREPKAVRKARGIVHTPSELAAWAMQRVDEALRSVLDCERGLSDERLCVLDPAVGTGVWLAAALARTSPAQAAARTWLGFDVDPDVLDTARALLEPSARERAVGLELQHANTLELADPWPRDGVARVRVIVGNPPWASRSLSRGTPLSDTWLLDFTRDAHGQALGERRIGVLSDDYVRFFRWALEQARTAAHGAIVCFATNSSYLDGPVHRGMRAQLLEAFDRIEVLDLGGNALVARQGDRDENLFGVRVGAALTLAVRRATHDPGRMGAVAYRRVTGSREHKLNALREDGLGRERVFVPEAPAYRFVPSPLRAQGAALGFRLDQAFPFHREGVQTNRDALVIASHPTTLLARLEDIARGTVPLERSRHFDPDDARRRLARELERDPHACVAELAYRPLDTRFVCTVAPLCHRPRPELAAAVARSSLCLLSVRKDRGHAPFHLFAASRVVADACYLSARSSCRTRVFPSHTADGSENLAAPVRDKLAALLGDAPSSVDVLEYALGVLASESFRERAGEALKLDYPEMPWPHAREGFVRMRDAGRGLVAALIGALPPLGLGETSPPGLEDLDTEALMIDVRARLLRRAGSDEVVDVPESAWGARLGHHRLLEAALRARREWCISDVLGVVARATLWAAACAAAEHSYFECFGA